MPVSRGRNAEAAGLGNRFTQEVEQRLADARVLDAGGSEKKPHAASQSGYRRPDLPSAYRSVRGRDSQTIENSSAPAASSLTSSGDIPAHWQASVAFPRRRVRWRKEASRPQPIDGGRRGRTLHGECFSASYPARATSFQPASIAAYSRHSPGTPLSSCRPRSWNPMPVPAKPRTATRSIGPSPRIE